MDRTAADIKEEIAIFRTAIKNIALTGESYTIGSGASSRTFTAADIDKLKSHLFDLQTELSSINDDGILVGF